MNPTPDPSSGPPPLAPPTVPGVISSPARPTTWPAVLGVISLILGLFGALQGAWSLIAPLLMRPLTNAAGPGANITVWGVSDNYQGALLAVGVATTFAGVLLVISGILLLQRRELGARLAVLWAVFKIVVAAFSAVIGYFVQIEMFQKMSSQQNPPMPAFAASMGRPMALAGVVIGVAWTCIYPTFVLVWFTRRRVRAEVRSWAARPPAARLR